jgi:hypothetical protein
MRGNGDPLSLTMASVDLVNPVFHQLDISVPLDIPDAVTPKDEKLRVNVYLRDGATCRTSIPTPPEDRTHETV